MSSRLAVLLILLLAGCTAATVPTFGPLPVIEAQQQRVIGQRVRWGGDIVSVTARADHTCFEVVDRPLDRDARPLAGAPSDGRFYACTAGFYDPALYASGQLTVVGCLERPTSKGLVDAGAALPRVATERLYLWPLPAPGRLESQPDMFWWPHEVGSQRYWW